MPDLLMAKPSMLQVQEHGEGHVVILVVAYLVKCADRLDIEMTKSKLEDLARDMLDKYPTDSLEDIREALKKGGQGTYTFGHEKRGVLSMGLISNWMEQHLEEKAITREAQMGKAKTNREQSHPLDVDMERLKMEGESYIKIVRERRKEWYANGAKFLDEQAEREKARKHAQVAADREKQVNELNYQAYKSSDDFVKERQDAKYAFWEKELATYSAEQLESVKRMNQDDKRLQEIIERIKAKEV